MSSQRAYLDWNATAPLLDEARAAMLQALECRGNPSSVHAEGRAARSRIEEAREQVAALVNARPQDVIFTGGATEANTIVLAGASDQVVVAAIEHASVLEPARASGKPLHLLPCRSDGVTDLAMLGAESRFAWGQSPLVSLALANSETGVLQPIRELLASVPEHARVHTDATQAVGRVPVDVAELGVDYMSFSSHKLGGPKGAGALVVREGAPLTTLLRGGGQERGRRAGTENVAAIVGFGAAAAAVARRRLAAMSGVADIITRIEAMVRAAVPEAVVIGGDAPRLANTTCIAVPGRSAETLVAMFDLAGVAVSAGAACSSGKVGASHVLAAMGLRPDLARSAIRISIGPETGEAELAVLAGALHSITRRVASAA